MIKINDEKLAGRGFRNIFLVQNRNWWSDCPYPYDKRRDLVLTFDFGLLQQITASGGTAAYLDHLMDAEEMERYNVETYRFFDSWYLNSEGNDIFSYKGLDFGNSLRLDFWNDITYFIRLFINLMGVRGLHYQQFYSGLEDASVSKVLEILGMQCEHWGSCATDKKEYYFPSFRWMKENIRPQRLRQRLGSAAYRVIDFVIWWGEALGLFKTAMKDVFVDRYFPTEAIVDRLKRDKKVNLFMASYTRTRGILNERRLRVGKPSREKNTLAAVVMRRFIAQRQVAWEIEGVDLSAALYRIIEEKIAPVMPQCLQIIDSIVAFFAKRDLKLFVLTANVGLINGILFEYCKKKEVTTYFIINGMMVHRFPAEDTRFVTLINSYGESIKEHYFRNQDNIVCCGDPRMDQYINLIVPKEINYREPVIMIGAGGFSNIDLNSYVAAEFDFLDGIMQALRILAGRSRKMTVLLKVRSNGYISQYQNFLQEYYPEIPVEIFDAIPFGNLIQKADLYLSIYSGTLFEASLLGIPTIYYKKDTSLLNPPYDGGSELVTAISVDDLVEKMELFYQQSTIFNLFREKAVMEKYIGPLDGNNLQRNMDFIYSVISGEVKNGSAAPA